MKDCHFFKYAFWWLILVLPIQHSLSAVYYVNDGVTNGDVYATSPGSDANNGLTPATPKLTVTNLLTSYSLVAGDVVYIDTGSYSNYAVGINASGVEGNPIIFQGSTNTQAGGSVFNRNNPASSTWSLVGRTHVVLRDMTLRGAGYGLYLINSTNITIERLVLRNNALSGLFIESFSHNMVAKNCLFAQNSSFQIIQLNSTNASIESSVIWGDNGVQNWGGSGGVLKLSNSVIRSSGSQNFALRRQLPIQSDYNIYVLVNRANLMSTGGDLKDALPRLHDVQRIFGTDWYSTVVEDPLFADPNNFDFHPRSQFGRYFNGSFTNDTVTSITLDFGPVSFGFTNETSPNGVRINAGLYGNTPEASRSPTSRFINVRTYNDGGVASGTAARVTWVAGNALTGDTVRLEYSLNGGVSWGIIATNVPATNETAFWNTTLDGSSGAAKWRIYYELFPGVAATNNGYFSIRNTNLTFYANDASTTGDVYTVAVGQSNNIATAASPKNNLNNILIEHTVSPGDVIYVDTGYYPVTNTMILSSRERGADGNPIKFIGSTNHAAGGSILDRQNTSSFLFSLDYAAFIEFLHLDLRNASRGIVAFQSPSCVVRYSTLRNHLTLLDINNSSHNWIIENNVFDGGVTFAADIRTTNNVFMNNSVRGPRGINLLGSVNYRNNIVNITASAGRVFQLLSGSFIGVPDYNIYWLQNGAQFAQVGATLYPTLHTYQKVFDREWRSAELDPLFAVSTNSDLHVQSASGRWSGGSFTNDSFTSPAIDLGSPGDAFSQEPTPNGSRINAGAFGNTYQASKSRTNAWLLALTLNEGGQFNAPGDSIYWNHGNLVSGATVRVEFSFNGGSSWSVLSTNIAVTNGMYTVTATNFGSSQFAVWRVVLESEPSVLDANNTNFIFRAGPFTYFVNDASTAGDVYCTAPGNDANLGTTPDLPKATLSAILTNYTLAAGDVVYVDTGIYQSSQTTMFSPLASGTNGNPVLIRGSTNVLAGGTILQGPLAQISPGVTFNSGCQYIRFQDFTIQRWNNGVTVGTSVGIELLRIRSELNSLSGISASGASGMIVRQSALRANSQQGISIGSSGDVALLNSVVWMNGGGAIQSSGARVMVTNSVLGVRGTGRVVYQAPTLTNIVANYNHVVTEQDASVASVSSLDRFMDTLSAWQSESGMDRLSLDVNDPLFVNADEGDFHLRSQTVQGRFDPLLGWVTDTVTSPLIDAGDPSFDASLEPMPNGGRINIGIYGNTPQASRIDFPKLQVGNLLQGGWVKGTSTLHWTAANFGSNEMVSLEVSIDGGEAWSLLTTGILASVEAYAWNTTTQAVSVAGLWRVTSLSNPSLTSQTTNFFGIRNGPLTYYVNDASNSGSVFTVSSGSATNWVATTNRPLSSLATVFERYDIEPGDRIFVDRGTYNFSAPVIIGSRDSGATNSGVVSIIGASACNLDGTPVADLVAVGFGTKGLQMLGARSVTVSNILFRQAGTAIEVTTSRDLQFHGLHVVGSSLTNGVLVSGSTNILFSRSLFANNNGYGWTGRDNVQTRIMNSVLVSNRLGAIRLDGGQLGVTNSVLIASGSVAALFSEINSGTVRSDYNNLLNSDGADVARYRNRVHKNPSSWQEATTNDLRSLSHPPGFVNETAGDYHLLSQAGRFNSATCSVVTDSVSSVMLDTGDPSSEFGNELAPNGGRINIGQFGNHPEASRSPTNARLLTLSLNSGGTVRGTNTLYWFANQPASGHQVYIDVSFDNGLSWTNVATNLSASAGSFVWDSSALPSSPLSRWRISSQNDPALSSTSITAFALSNGSIGYYVNDALTTGDVYTTSAGSTSNDGVTPDSPVSKISEIFSRYQPAPGDVVYVDTGSYGADFTRLDGNNSGSSTNSVMIVGSTNWFQGGSRFDLQRQGPLLSLQGTRSLNISGLTVTNAKVGFVIASSSNIWFDQVHYVGMTDDILPFSAGFWIDSGSEVRIERSTIQGVTNRLNSAGILMQATLAPNSIQILNSVLWGNSFGIWAQQPASIQISNSVIYGTGSGSVGILAPGSTIASDYNNYRMVEGARIAQLNGSLSTNPPISVAQSFATLQSWSDLTGRDIHSLTHEPGFADPASIDYGLLSRGGRYASSGVVTDSVTSVLIDGGDPSADFSNEPAPNGSRINIGSQGNTGMASLSSTNRAIIIKSLNDGGIAYGTNFMLRWDLRGDFTGRLVRIQVTAEYPVGWISIVTNWPATSNVFNWNTMHQASLPKYHWRVYDEETPSIEAINEQPFSLRNSNFVFYVNDLFMTGDVYTASAGNATNTGLAANKPMDSLHRVLETYDVLGGDVIYIDTGVYNAGTAVRFQRSFVNADTNVLNIIGSTNESAGGTILQDHGLWVDGDQNILFEHLTLASSTNRGFPGIRLFSSKNIQANGIRIVGAGDGIAIRDSVDVAFRHCLVTGSMTNGINLSQGLLSNIRFEHGVIWTNRGNAVSSPRNISIRHSILAASGTGKYIYSGSSNSTIQADYNLYFLTDGARLGRMSFSQFEAFPKTLTTLADWQRSFRIDLRSLSTDPLLANPEMRDFHPKSMTGRWSPAIQNWVVDDVTSPLVDAGDALADVGSEPTPNGTRINIGLYGGTSFASKSPVVADFVIGSLNEGGSVSGTNVFLYWIARGPATGHNVRVEYSLNGGDSWSILASNVSPGTSSLIWDTTLLPSTVVALWRVSSEVQPSAIATAAQSFAIRNGPVSLYVNDASTLGDVYTVAPGTNSAKGVSPSAPKDSVSGILQAYELLPGDVIYVDTGTYTNSGTIAIDQTDAGVKVIGSTNSMMQGSRLLFVGPSTGIQLNEAPGTILENLRFEAVSTSISLELSDDVMLKGIHIRNAGLGIGVTSSDRCIVENSSIRNSDTALSLVSALGGQIRNVVLWSNRVSALTLNSSSALVENSVIGVMGGTGDTKRLGYTISANSSINSEYNLIYLRDGALVARRDVINTSFDEEWTHLSAWTRDTGNDRHSFSQDPGFANAIAGDFHPLSQQGRFNPDTGLFVVDTNTSVLIDSGSPQSEYAYESQPNGQRVDIGMYGNSLEASRSPTNARLWAATFGDGGSAKGSSVPLAWRAGGVATGHMVRLDFSADGGTNWSIIQSNVSATAGILFWDSSTNASWRGRWRVVSETEPAVSGPSASIFAIRNQGLSLYVNDDSTSGDVYTSSQGYQEYSGITPNDPRRDVQTVIDDYDLEPGDTIYIDTGEYLLGNTIRIGRYDAWQAATNLGPLQAGGTSLRIMGSTNDAVGGTTFIRTGSGSLMALDRALGVNLSRLNVRHFPRGGGVSFELADSTFSLLEWLQSRDASQGVSLTRSDSVRLTQMEFIGATSVGLNLAGSTNVSLYQSVLWSNKVAASVANRSQLNARNNVLVMLAPESIGWIRNDGSPDFAGTIDVNYNVFYSVNGAFIAELQGPYAGGRRRYERMLNWQRDTNLDLRSLHTNPDFANSTLYDFHPQSPYGRYNKVSGYITNTSDLFSALIDIGDPTLPYANETQPNGQRSNIGRYGNSDQSSLSPTNGSIQVLTFNDGGSGSGEITLRWSVSGIAVSHPVHLEFSNDGGNTWTNISSNVLASTESYLWDSESYGRAAAGVWRITSQIDPSVVSQTEQFFALRQGGSIPYYVNDGSTAGDVYCTEIGNNANTGFLPSTPKATLQALFDDIDLEPGDIVYIDTGIYAQNLNVLWGEFDSGQGTNYVTLRGSTNNAAGGTVLNRITGLGSVLQIRNAQAVAVEHLTVRNAGAGISVELCIDVSLHSIIAKENNSAGISVAGSTDVVVQNSVLWNNGGSGVVVGEFNTESSIFEAMAEMRNCTVWGNPYGVRVNKGGNINTVNNLIHVNGPASRVYYLDDGININAEFNAYFRLSGALLAEREVVFGGHQFFGRLLDWQRDNGNDLRTLSHNPLVANSSAGDFHLVSASGRVLPSGGITNDPVGQYSPLLDTGRPLDTWTNEPLPNGGRINIGRYGNTFEASRSRTNGWLLALSLNDGGQIFGTNVIRWAAGNWSTNATVRVEYANNGVDFSLISSNVPVYQDGFVWDVSGEPVTQFARWRVISESDTNVISTVQMPFVIKNEPLVIYVNDSSTAGDVYTFAVGSNTNSGLHPSFPLHDVGVVLENFPLGAGDVLYIDTGFYSSTNQNGLRLGLIGETLKEGAVDNPIRIIGSTNRLAGGTAIQNPGLVNYGIRVLNTRHIELNHLSAFGFTNGIEITGSADVKLNWIQSHQNQNGIVVNNVIEANMTHCSAWGNDQYGLSVDGTFSSATWSQGILWSNRVSNIRHIFGSLSVSNTIIGAVASNSVVYEINSKEAFQRGDFNIYWSGPENDLVFLDNFGGVRYRTVRAWQAARGMDVNSVLIDPLFVNPAAGDFHLSSDEGRFNSFSGLFVKDSDTSWAIDAGDVFGPFAEETEPNGSRLNTGLFGNTGEASRSSTNPALLVVSLRDGGTAASPQPLIWLARGMTSNDTVLLEYTANDGLGWEVIASNVPALQQNILWTNGLLESTPLARWRVTLESNPAIEDVTESTFTVRNGPILYYVNDTNTLGDMYTLQPGSILNNGITVSSPVHSVSTIINRFDLEGGDVVYVDTGLYQFTNSLVILGDDSGVTTNRVTIQGSTFRPAGGTRFRAGDGMETNAVVEFIRVDYFGLADIIIENAHVGINVQNPSPRANGLLFERVEVRDGGRAGFLFQSSSDNHLERTLVHRMQGLGVDLVGGGLSINSSVLWSNGLGGVLAGSASLKISNSVIHAFGGITNAAIILSKSTLESDYNNYFIEGNTSYAIIEGEPLTGLPQVYFLTTQDVHSISVDPLFADPDNNDYHPRSEAGRYDPDLQFFVTGDTNYSWIIDTGNPLASFENEPFPNGVRRNIGLFGNSVEASKSRGDPWLLAVTAMAGGRAGDIFPLHWFSGNIDLTNRVNLEYSVDAGTNWIPIVSNIPIDQDGHLWNSLDEDPFQSPTTKWRVSLVSNTNVSDETDRIFGLNGPFTFYINDLDVAGDLYTTVPGDDTNLGISSNAPKLTLRSTLDFWDIDPLDVILMDTGTYLISSNDIATVRSNNRGQAGLPVTIRGSENGVIWDGTPVKQQSDVETIFTIDANYILVDNITITNGAISVLGTNNVFRGVEIHNGDLSINGAFTVVENFSFESTFLTVQGADSLIISGQVRNGTIVLDGSRSVLKNTVASGSVSPLLVIGGTNISVINNTLVADRTAIQQIGADSVSVIRNNIIVADGANGTAFAIERQGGTAASDYNMFIVRNGAWFGSAGDGLWEKLIYWQEKSGQDTNSISADPLFANEGLSDFHLRSTSGRWQGASWVVDSEHSPAIDSGAPIDSFSNEVVPNGGRINIGAYGNTDEASKSRTNAWLYAITMNDGGVIRGTNSLRWLAGAVNSTNRVILQYSANNGTSWITIASDLPVNQGLYTWDTTTASNTLDALWRVMLEADTNVMDQTDANFNIRNDVRVFYVNDAVTSGDVYTFASGSPTNDGRTPFTPKATLEDLLSYYDTEPFDTIYLDTGSFISSEIHVIWSRGGDSNGTLTIQGSTNYAAGGTVIRRPGKSGNALVVNANFVTIRDIVFENAGVGLLLDTNRWNVVEQVGARSNAVGIQVRGGNDHVIRSSRVWQNNAGGITVANAENIKVENISFVNNTPFALSYDAVPNSIIQNNIFYFDVATSNQQFALTGPTGTVLTTFIDYNVYYFGTMSRSNAFIYGTYANLLPWQRERFKDFRSAITNPLFESVSSNKFHLRSEAGRFDPGTATFVLDTNTSWAIDKGNPYSAFEREQTENGGRINIGAYGNTFYASKGTTNQTVFARTGNDYLPISENENPYPLIWHTLNLPFDKVFSVQYSGDGGNEWVTLQSGVNAYQEYIIWTNSIAFNSFNARWRLLEVGPGVTNVWDINDGQIRTFFGVHRISSIKPEPGGKNTIIWRGAWDEDYQIQFATNNFFSTNKLHNWANLGPVTNLSIGGDIPYTDVDSTQSPFRIYRVLWLGTNGIPYQ